MIETSSPTDLGDAKSFCKKIAEKTRRFADYKRENHEAQTTGQLRCLVWPLFFDHTARESERFIMRLEQLGMGEVEFDKDELIPLNWNKVTRVSVRYCEVYLGKEGERGNLFRSAFRQ